MDGKYDLVIIGTGTASRAAASRCRAKGWSVAVIDSRPFGGTCALRGCDPKRVLIGVAEAFEQAGRLDGKGLYGASNLQLRWSDLMEFKSQFVKGVSQREEESYRKQGVDTFHGAARFLDLRTLDVDGRRLEGNFILIATGAEPAKLNFFGAEYVVTSDDFLELLSLPGRIVIIGGGYIAFEFAHLASRVGAAVNILEMAPRVLGNFDADMVELLVKASRRLGVAIYTESQVRGIEKRDRDFVVRADVGGKEAMFEADLVVHGAGRVPALEALRPERGGVQLDGRRLRLNDFLQSISNPAVYAAGDAAGRGPALTPVAELEGYLAAGNMVEGNRYRADYSVVPSAVFTIPPLAAVGLTEEQAAAKGLRVKVNYQETTDWYHNRRIGGRCSGFKILLDEDSRRIVGAHVLGSNAEEIINVFAMAMKAGMRAPELRQFPFAYPTAASEIEYML